MKTRLTMAALLALASPLAPAAAQTAPAIAQTVTGTRLDVVAEGQVTRVPDHVRIAAGVTVLAPTASEAIRQNAAQMERVRAALRSAGIAERDIQTSSISLNPDWRMEDGREAPVLAGYRASNQVSVRFRDVANAGRILDALVTAGANEISGPSFGIDRPEPALDEARTLALAGARARAELYARALGMRVKRILWVSESGGMPFQAMGAMALEARMDAGTRINPGEQVLSVSLTVSFELE